MTHSEVQVLQFFTGVVLGILSAVLYSYQSEIKWHTILTNVLATTFAISAVVLVNISEVLRPAPHIW